MKSAREIVSEAWHYSLLFRDRLFWFGFVPGLLSIVASAGYLLWYVWITGDASFLHNLFVFGNKNIVESLTQEYSLGTFGGGIFVLGFFVLWFFVTTFCRAAITRILSDAKKKLPEANPIPEIVSKKIPLIATAMIRHGLAPAAFFAEWILFAQQGGILDGVITFSLLLFGALGIVFLFFLAFLPQAIVLKNADFIEASGISFHMTLSQFGLFLRLFLIFLLIELRVFISVLFTFAVPLLIIGVGGFLAHLLSPNMGYFLIGALTTVIALGMAYLLGILFIFSETIRTIAFLKFHKNENTYF